LAYSRHSPRISIAAPRRCAGIRPSLPVAGASAAARELAVLVLDHERPKLADRMIDEAGVDHPLGRELHGRHLVLHVPGVDVEHAGDVDLAVRTAARP